MGSLQAFSKVWKCFVDCLAILCCLISFTGCSTMAGMFGKKPEPEATAPLSPIPISGPESKYQWAMQSFESGDYREALIRFDEISREDFGSSSYAGNLPYYRGRSLFYLGKFREAFQALEQFVSANPLSDLSANARLHMLLSQIHLRDWSKAAVLAAEASIKDTVAGNLVLIRLLWAEALMEQAEIVGARRILNEATTSLRSLPRESFSSDVLGEGLDNLEDRRAWLAAAIETKQCRFLPLGRLPHGRKARIRTASQWLEKRGQCLTRGIAISLEVMRKLGPRWSQVLVENMQEACNDLASSANTLESEGRFSADEAKELLRPELRRSFYQILNALENAGKEAQRLGRPDRIYQDLAANLDSVLQRLSVEASTSDRSL